MISVKHKYKNIVSIIIPVYNEKLYLLEALESVINQTYKNLEIIIIDDGSYDGSENICDEYAKKDSRIKVIHKKNEGLSAARNQGLDNIRGEYVAFLDSDDLYHPKMIQTMLEALLFDNTDCVICKHAAFDRTKGVNFKKYKNKISKKIYTRNEILKETACGKIDAFAWNKLYKKNLFENIRYPVGQNYEDISVILEIFEKTKKVSILEKKLVWHRKHLNSITSTVSLKNYQDLCKAFDSFELFIKNHIPEIFTKNDLKTIRQNNLNCLFYKYANTIYRNIPNKKNIQKFLIEKIKERNADDEIKDFSTETHLINYLLFNAPKIFRFGALFYPAIRRFIKR